MEDKNKSKRSRCRYHFPDITVEGEETKIIHYCIKEMDELNEEVTCTEEKCEKCKKFNSKYIEFPIKVNKIQNNPIEKASFTADEGSIVEIRPCGDEYDGKSYMGFFLGELPISIFNTYDSKSKVLTNSTINNPAIFVPALGKIIYGCESWWKLIENVDELEKLAKEDINNARYEKMLKSISGNKKVSPKKSEKSIKELREMTNLSKKEFCDKYEIPLSTLNKWETEEGKSNHRECPVYLKKLLEKAIKNDFNL